jgi:hypothetical protein
VTVPRDGHCPEVGFFRRDFWFLVGLTVDGTLYPILLLDWLGWL